MLQLSNILNTPLNYVGFHFLSIVKHAIELADLLDYLEHSPAGSMIIGDFKLGQFILVDGTIKLGDLDDLSATEPECKNDCIVKVAGEPPVNGTYLFLRTLRRRVFILLSQSSFAFSHF